MQNFSLVGHVGFACSNDKQTQVEFYYNRYVTQLKMLKTAVSRETVKHTLLF